MQKPGGGKQNGGGGAPNVEVKNRGAGRLDFRLDGRDDDYLETLVGVRPDKGELAEVELDVAKLARVPFSAVDALEKLERYRFHLVPVPPDLSAALQAAIYSLMHLIS